MKRLLLLPLLALGFHSCAPTPSIDQHGHVHIRQSSAQMRTMGLNEFSKIKKKKKISHSARYNAQVQRVAARLQRVIHLPGAQWEFVVFEDSSPNAFALPGGKVGVHTGLFQITKNDAGLAAVLGHEIGHVTSDHAGARQKNQLGIVLGGVVLDQVVKRQGASSADRAKVAGIYGAGATVGHALPHSRFHELEADRIGAIFMARAGYDPRESVALWKRFAAYNNKRGRKMPEFLRTHPLDDTRIRSLESFMPTALKEYKKR